MYWLPRILVIGLIIGISLYTVILFSDVSIDEILFYLIPSFVLLTVLEIVWKHEKFGGILFLLLSFGFLFIYQVYISISIFLSLVVIGSLFLVDSYRLHRIITQQHI
ncbi:hypothetical protein BH09PAT1_BH09PAT1_4510 [soil metagenome]